MGNTQYVYLKGENNEDETIAVNLEENTNDSGDDVERYKINAGNGKYSNLLKLSKTEQESLMMKNIARFKRLKTTGFDLEKDSVEVFDYYVLSAKAYFDAFIELLMKPKKEVYSAYRKAERNKDFLPLKNKDFMLLFEKIKKNIGGVQRILIAKLNEAQTELELGQIVEMQMFEFIFVSLGALFCFELEKALGAIKGNESILSSKSTKHDRVLFLDESGAFTCDLWLRYFANGIKMIGVPSKQNTSYDVNMSCPLYFIEHDYTHNFVIDGIGDQRKLQAKSTVVKIQRFLDLWKTGTHELRETICEFFFIRYHENDLPFFLDFNKILRILQENQFITEPKISFFDESMNVYFDLLEKEILDKIEQITEMQSLSI